ncbi:MAG: phosphoribosylformylglycinamidine cyclo-ligase [Candidatus Solincola sediminis]|uniref:Phosphoribosylformylglycinamidine cyclo-ligase n=1 Tax=Candidatus Solincola sediminis TaxID=1797199 RepID=A0A1F2WK60_9ACTN|nr:MAG: phosphoribosylformylglycinamidine cyclo-ligase [Candidatus Solincola sediminis]OFW57250.1 MAG: phosphoribosylformylglycinamidine cyclo-ligase [Candidatus Solincola sediminis]
MDKDNQDCGLPLAYSDAGVDIEAGKRAVELIKGEVESTRRPEVISDIGGFGAMFSAAFKGHKDPVLVSSADGVGTKLQVAQMLERHDSVGIDLVAMCADDIVTCGAEPLFMLDYISMGKLRPEKIEQIVKGIAAGCRRAGCSLTGGEMAEHPGVMEEDEYDLSGFVVGVVDREGIIDGSRIAAGDIILGLASSGLHSNGYSLVRKVFFELNDFDPGDNLKGLAGTLGDELLTPTEIYAPAILKLAREVDVKGIAHITGGGLIENLPRILPSHVDAVIDLNSWHPPNIFRIIESMGGVEQVEMFTTFNMGIGMVVVVGLKGHRQAIQNLGLSHIKATRIGEIHPGTGGICLTC